MRLTRLLITIFDVGVFYASDITQRCTIVDRTSVPHFRNARQHNHFGFKSLDQTVWKLLEIDVAFLIMASHEQRLKNLRVYETPHVDPNK